MTDLVERLRGATTEIVSVHSAGGPDVVGLLGAAADALEAAQAEASRAQNEMANVIIQADCLRHYAQLTDERKHKFLPTVGEVQAGHFEDIAIRAFPALSALLEEKRQARALEKEARNG